MILCHSGCLGPLDIPNCTPENQRSVGALLLLQPPDLFQFRDARWPFKDAVEDA